MNRNRVTALAFLVVAMAGGAASAGALAADGSWAPWGPGEGTIQAMAFDPAAGPAGVCIAPQLGGIYCSRDGGATWVPQNEGLDGANVVALAAEPAVPGGLLAVTAGGALYRRGGPAWELVYDGRAWGTLSTSLLDRPFAVLLVPEPEHGGRPARLFLSAGTGVFRSDDRGGTWHRVLATAEPVSDLAFDPTLPETLFVGFAGPFGGSGGLLKSVDGGASWTAVGPPGGWPYGVTAVGVAGGNGGAPPTVFAAQRYPGLFRSRDGGLTWEALSTATTPNAQNLVAALAVDPASPETVVAARADGVFLSPDRGNTWRLLGGREPPFVAWEVERLALGFGAWRVYAATRSFGLFATANRGRRWIQYGSSQAGEGGDGVLRFDPADPSTVIALLGGFAYRSLDGGATWESFPTLRAINDLAFGPATRGAPDGTLYAASIFGLQASVDGGASWRFSDFNAFFAVAVVGRRTLLGGGCGVWLSHDGGRTSRATLSCDDPGDGSHPSDFSRQVNAFVVDPGDSRQVYARVSEVTGERDPKVLKRVFHSADGGITWRPVIDGGDVVAIDPGRSGTVYLLAGTELRRSTDHGRTFKPIPTTGLGDFKALDLAVDPAAPSLLYAAGVGGVRRSVDGGRSWTADDRGLAAQPPFDPPGGLLASRLYFAPEAPGTLYVAANGIFYAREVP